jgi:hypothetical protein
VIRYAAALIATGTAGFLAGGAAGASAAVVASMVVLLARWWLRARNAQSLPKPTEQPPSAYADIEEVIDSLDDLARERNWDLGKRFDIARMACENPTLTFDELERRYDLGLRPAPDKIRQDSSERP